MEQINIPLDINSLKITAQTMDKKGNIILDVVSKNTNSICHKCGNPATKPNGVAPVRLIRHLSILDTPVYLRITPIRYSCEHCDDHPTTTEQYDWCDRNTTTTKGLENYLMRYLINSTIEDVSKKEKIGQRVIQSALDRQIQKEVDWNKIDNLETIGIDEIATKKGHDSYVTVISAKFKEESPMVLTVIDKREKEDIKTFLQSIPDRLKKTVNQVCTDMYDGYVNAIIEFGDRISL